MAAYPGHVVSFTSQSDGDVIFAAEPNALADEILALENTVGVNPHISTTAGGAFLSVSTTFASLVDRLANIEAGIVGDVHTQYVHKAGGDTVTGGAGTGPALKIVPGSTGQGVAFTDSSGTTQVYTDSSGILWINGGNRAIGANNAATTVSTQAAGDGPSVGTSTTFARESHKHGMPAADDVAGTASFRTLGTGSRQAAAGNHSHNFFSSTQIATYSTTSGSAMAVPSGDWPSVAFTVGPLGKALITISGEVTCLVPSGDGGGTSVYWAIASVLNAQDGIGDIYAFAGPPSLIAIFRGSRSYSLTGLTPGASLTVLPFINNDPNVTSGSIQNGQLIVQTS